MMEREGIIIYKCTSHPSNIKNWTPYKFVVDPPQVTLTRLVQGLQKYFRCQINSKKSIFNATYYLRAFMLDV